VILLFGQKRTHALKEFTLIMISGSPTSQLPKNSSRKPYSRKLLANFSLVPKPKYLQQLAWTRSDHYCYCNGPDVGDMVSCDNPECQFQWFHLSCLGLEKLPTTKYWYCPDCRKLPNRRRSIKHKTCVHNRSKTH